MIRLNAKYATFHGLFLALTLTFFISSVAMAQGQSGTTLIASKTATGFWERTIKYDWTIVKEADPTSITLGSGESGDIEYTITVTRTKVSEVDAYGVRGTITVTNGGEIATENLQIADQVQYKIPGPGQFQDLAGATQTITPAQLGPGETKTYEYEIKFTPVAGVLYKNVARVTITNHSGWLGTPFGSNPKADFTPPAAPTIIEIDESASVTDVTDEITFVCEPSLSVDEEDIQSWPWGVTGDDLDVDGKGGIIYALTILAAADLPCDLHCDFDNIATLTEGDTGVKRTASASVEIMTAPCEGSACETAFAYGGDDATCFIDLGFGNWGWTNGPLGEGSYSFPIYAAAGQCDLSKGTLVGTLEIVYSGGTATIEYEMDAGFTMDETQLYVGNDILPKKGGEYTVAPGQYGNIHDLDGASSDSYTITDLSGDIYVVAHAVVCGF